MARSGGAEMVSQVSGWESRFLGEFVDGVLVVAAGGLEWAGLGGGELRQAGAEQPVVDTGQEQRVVEPGLGELVAVAVGMRVIRPWVRSRRRS